MSRRIATAAKLARIEGDPRLAVLTDLKIGIDTARDAIRSTDPTDRQAASSDAKLAYTRALTLMTQAQDAMTDAIIQQQCMYLEALLRKIDTPAE